MRLCAPSQDGVNEFEAPHSSSIEISQDHTIPNGSIVAALTLTAEGSEEWILARIKSFDGHSYTAEDAEVEEEPSIEIPQKE